MITRYARRPIFWVLLYLSMLISPLMAFFLIDSSLGVRNFQITYWLITLAGGIYACLVPLIITRMITYDLYYDATSLLLARSQVVMGRKGALAEAGPDSKTLIHIKDIESLAIIGAIIAASIKLKDGTTVFLFLPFTFADFDSLLKELDGKGIRIAR